MPPISTQAEYEAAIAEQNEANRQRLRESEARISRMNQELAEKTVRVALVKHRGNIRVEAVDDVIGLLAKRVQVVGGEPPRVIDETGRPMANPRNPGRPMTVDELVADYLANRPYLRPAGSMGGDNVQGTGGGGRWSIDRAIKDSKYNADWAKADPDGNAKAWREHLEELDSELRRRGNP